MNTYLGEMSRWHEQSLPAGMVVLLVLASSTIALPQAPAPANPSRDPSVSQNPALVASASAAMVSAGLKPYVDPKPADILEWTAVGDSFTAGVGSVGLADFIDSSNDCSRYKVSGSRVTTIPHIRCV